MTSTARADALGNPASTPSDALLALAARCEREEPTFALECEIAAATYPAGAVACIEGVWIVNKRGTPLTPIWEPLHPARYTTSLDAAVTLVPEGWAWFVEWIGAPFSEGRARLWIPAQRTQKLTVENVNTQAKTPTMALCAAALRARAAELEQEGSPTSSPDGEAGGTTPSGGNNT